MSPAHLICFGLGFSARVLAMRLVKQGWKVSGTVRNPVAAASTPSLPVGVTLLAFDGVRASDEVKRALMSATHVLGSIPPDAAGDPALRGFRGAIAAVPHLQWLGYLSTVGVYGDQQGGEVDEETPASPESERGRRRLAAEAAWLDLADAVECRAHVFRLPGIYGPGRSAIDNLRSGKAHRIIKPGQIFNRIHVDDLAAAVALALSAKTPSRVYNLTDDEPSPPQDVVTFAAELIGVSAPPEVAFDAAALSPMARSFYGASKRVANARIKRELDWRPLYPSYREGLRAIWANAH